MKHKVMLIFVKCVNMILGLMAVLSICIFAENIHILLIFFNIKIGNYK